MARGLTILLGLLGFGLAGLMLGIFVSRGYGMIRPTTPVPRLLGGYVFGVALIAGALLVRIRPGVVKSIVLLIGIGTFALLLALGGFIVSVALHFE